MGIRVIARVRPQQKNELDKDVIVSTSRRNDASVVKIPNPKKESETFSFQFNGVYDESCTQQQVFDHEISPTIKHLFQGFDVTIFAYGSTGTGKTHTMRGGKNLADRGVIPRLLSGVYRRARKIMKDANETVNVEISLSYYEIYNDKVFDLFEAPEKRSMSGLPLRDNGGKTVVVGLTERPCESLREFERLYDAANINRSTSATKLNAASSRSHAILRLKLSVITGDQVRTSLASAIDLAGSEDNRRTENGKERMLESASINKSLFTLAKCVEAISRGDERIPYRESKMTRILSLGQNNGITVMILNLAPVRSYHLDTLSSLNFANRTKKIEVREIENEPVIKGCSRAAPAMLSVPGTTIQRQPLRPLASTVHNASVQAANTAAKRADKQSKAFCVYSDKTRLSNPAGAYSRAIGIRQSSPLKRPSDTFTSSTSRPAKRPTLVSKPHSAMSQQAIEDMIERKVTDILAAKALDQPSVAPQPEISDEVQRRLDMLEKKIGDREDGREQGLTFLLMAKQHAVRGEDASALRMYRLAKDFFPENKKLDLKIARLVEKIDHKKQVPESQRSDDALDQRAGKSFSQVAGDESYSESREGFGTHESNGAFKYRSKGERRQCWPAGVESGMHTPRTRQLLEVVNTRDIAQIRLLKCVGNKRAEAMIEALAAADEGESRVTRLTCLEQLSSLKGVGSKTVENMRAGFS